MKITVQYFNGLTDSVSCKNSCRRRYADVQVGTVLVFNPRLGWCLIQLLPDRSRDDLKLVLVG